MRSPEIRLRAERRLGELITAQKEAGLMNRAVRLSGTTEGRSSALVSDEGRSNPTLADVGVSHDLPSRSQTLAAVPEAEFESEVGESGVTV